MSWKEKSLKHIMRKEGFENLISIGRIERSKARGKQRTPKLTNVCEWMADQRQEGAVKY